MLASYLLASHEATSLARATSIGIGTKRETLQYTTPHRGPHYTSTKRLNSVYTVRRYYAPVTSHQPSAKHDTQIDHEPGRANMRMTRAAQRAREVETELDEHDNLIAIHEDADISQQDEDDESEQMGRPVLKDITDVENSSSATFEDASELKMSPRGKCFAKGEGRKGGDKKTIDQASEKMELKQKPLPVDFESYLPEDREQLQQTSVSEDNKAQEQAETLQAQESTLEPEEPSQTSEQASTEFDKLVQTLVSSATPKKPIPSFTSKTPKFDPEVHIPTQEPESSQNSQEDSFVVSIKSRSPTKMSREPSHDSFVESIKSRTPARRTSRIEDSVEAIDALEDALEEFSGNLPNIQHNLEVPDSPIKTKTPVSARSLPPSARKTALRNVASAKNSTPMKASPSKSASVRLSPGKTKASPLKVATPRTNSGRVSTVKPNKPPTVKKSTTRPSTIVTKSRPSVRPSTTQIATEAAKSMSFSNSPLKKLGPAPKRVASEQLSTSRPAFVPIKSSKAPTRSSFALPGDAIAAKLKAQREARRISEEAEKEKRVFKARPAPKQASRPSVIPRENKASQARMSAIGRIVSDGSDGGNTSGKENVAPKPANIRPITNKTNNLTINKTRPAGTKANSAARRTTSTTTAVTIPPKPHQGTRTAPRASFAPLPRVASLSTTTTTTIPPITPRTSVQEKVKGKEVFDKPANQIKTQLEEKKEREEAAKKARVEAAERGRVASREWAERQRVKALNSKGKDGMGREGVEV